MGAEDLFRGFLPVGTLTDPIETGAVLASAATIAPVRAITTVSGTTQITTITLPYTGFCGEITLIPTGAFTTTTGGNIGLASTAVVGKALKMTYSQAAGLWYPSY